MSASQGCNDDTAVVESFKEALKQRIGEDRFRMWFAEQVTIAVESATESALHPGPLSQAEPTLTTSSIHTKRIAVTVRGEFAQQRLSRNLMPEMRGAAMQAGGATMDVVVNVVDRPSRQAELPLGDDGRPQAQPRGAATRNMKHGTSSRRRKPVRGGQASTLDSLLTKSFRENSARQADAQDEQHRLTKVAVAAHAASAVLQPSLPFDVSPIESDGLETKQTAMLNSRSKQKPTADHPAVAASQTNSANRTATLPSMTLASFVVSDCNRLAHTAATLVLQSPGAASPLFLFGATGVGKTHLLTALADSFRRHHRFRRVIHTSAERFTNEFIAAIRDSTMTSFRRRYRDVDALLIDDVQFLGKKTSTLREMLYTVDDLAKAGRPMIFSGSHSPSDTPGLTNELAGRMSAGLVCNVQTMDVCVREALLRRAIDERCEFAWPEATLREMSALIAGDGRTISGIANLVATLQRMYKRMPSMDEIRQFGGELLRSASRSVNLTTIERAVCEAFQLETGQLQSHTQTRSVSEPRMLAMYLSRQLTSSAFTEISRHFGGRSHSTAIMASKRVTEWLESGKTIGRGVAAMSARDALNRIENILRAG